MAREYQSFDITVDFDDVIVPTAKLTMDFYNEMFDQQVDVAHFYTSPTIDTWGTDDLTIIQHRLEQIFAIIDRDTLAPTNDALWGMRELAKDGHRPHIVTSRDLSRKKITSQILQTYYSGYIESLTFTSQFVSEERLLGQRISKGLVSKALGARLHIDDHIRHGHDVLDMGVPSAFVFGNQPWNQQSEQRTGLERHLGWRSVVERVRYLAAN